VVVAAAVIAAVLRVVPADAGNNPNGIVFRNVGWFKGTEQVGDDNIQCEIPQVGTAISEGSYAMGLWNTFGEPTISYPNRNQGFSNPCGGWIQLQNNLQDQAVNVESVELKYRIPGAGRFRQFVPTRNAFPLACRQLRRYTQFVGTRINPVNSTQSSSNSGAPNVAFLQLLPAVTPDLISCLRAQYAPLPADVFVSLPLVIRATVVARSDAGEVYRSNTTRFTLSLRHLCGNQRVDDGEQCDPTTPFNSCASVCEDNVCLGTTVGCEVNSDCTGVCLPVGTPTECNCVF
jgi:hypothetical protein